MHTPTHAQQTRRTSLLGTQISSIASAASLRTFFLLIHRSSLRRQFKPSLPRVTIHPLPLLFYFASRFTLLHPPFAKRPVAHRVAAHPPLAVDRSSRSSRSLRRFGSRHDPPSHNTATTYRQHRIIGIFMPAMRLPSALLALRISDTRRLSLRAHARSHAGHTFASVCNRHRQPPAIASACDCL